MRSRDDFGGAKAKKSTKKVTHYCAFAMPRLIPEKPETVAGLAWFPFSRDSVKERNMAKTKRPKPKAKAPARQRDLLEWLKDKQNATAYVAAALANLKLEYPMDKERLAALANLKRKYPDPKDTRYRTALTKLNFKYVRDNVDAALVELKLSKDGREKVERADQAILNVIEAKKRKWQDVSDADLNGALAAVKHDFDPVAARTLIEYFYERIHNNDPYNEKVLLEFLDHAFGKIIKENRSLDIAFGFKLGRGKYRREDTTSVRDIRAAAHMELIMRKKQSLSYAKTAAANRLFPDVTGKGKGEKVVEMAYGRYRNVLSAIPRKLLEAMLLPGTRII